MFFKILAWVLKNDFIELTSHVTLNGPGTSSRMGDAACDIVDMVHHRVAALGRQVNTSVHPDDDVDGFAIQSAHDDMMMFNCGQSFGSQKSTFRI
jgi:hypothetical protein